MLVSGFATLCRCFRYFYSSRCKTIWLIDYGLPQWRAGVNTAVFTEDFKAIAFAPVLLILIVPWGYVFRHYLKKPGARWH